MKWVKVKYIQTTDKREIINPSYKAKIHFTKEGIFLINNKKLHFLPWHTIGEIVIE